MKPQFHKVPLLAHSSYVVKHEIKRHQTESNWHYHPEMELVYVMKGSGSRYIGNNISSFTAGEVILLGENIPHIWRYNKDTSHKGYGMDAESLSLHFHPEC
ncbi:MAG: cupin domain-containing protein, partial [Sphingobacterium sp.]